MPIHVWDEISGEAQLLREDGSNPLDCQWPLDDLDSPWQTDHVIDLPDGTRIVLESDDKAHTAVLITTREETR